MTGDQIDVFNNVNTPGIDCKGKAS